MGEKRVNVSSTPGKTKHFQTLNLNDHVTLCDCPGLVFPNFVATKAEMVSNGLLPIDQLRDCIGPTSLVCQRIKRELLEGIYGIILPVDKDENDNIIQRHPTPYELLNAYVFIRGFMSQKSGVPDQSRSARYILKDYVNGLLRYVAKPPPPKPKADPNTIPSETPLPTENNESNSSNESKDDQLKTKELPKEDNPPLQIDPYADFDPQEGQNLELIVSKEKYRMLMRQRSSNLSNGGVNNAPREKKQPIPKEKQLNYVKPPTYTEKVTNPYDPNFQAPTKQKLTKKDRKTKRMYEKLNRNKLFVPSDIK